MKYQGIMIIMFVMSTIMISACQYYPTIDEPTSYYDEPVLQIESVTNRVTGSVIKNITLQDFFVKNRPTKASYFFGHSPSLEQNIMLNEKDNNILCSLPSGLGFEMGQHTFRMSSPGFRDTVITINTTFATISFLGGLGNYRYSGGTKVRLTMTPQ
jgi:hypothetical protein